MDQTTTFVDLGLSEPLLAALGSVGYTHPTPIQAKSIPAVLMGKDLIGIAQTGTGKTAAFVLPMIDILAEGRARARMPRSLIVSPTRELAAQIAENFDKYTTNHSLNMALLIGGESMREQEDILKKGVDVLIATPGRLLDMFDRGAILLNDMQLFVVDEADRMLDMGFIPDIEKIAKLVQGSRARKPQTLFFSATMAPEIRRLCDTFLDKPREVEVARQSTTTDTITQRLVEVAYKQKRKALMTLLGTPGADQCIVFCNRKRDIDDLVSALQGKRYKSAPLHGDMAQPKRLEKLNAFKAKEVQILVCSDVAARGIDISDLPMVVNFDVPFNAEDYVHRIGRTGRAGKKGRAFTLASPSEGENVEAIEKLIGQEIPREELDMAVSERRRTPRKAADTKESDAPAAETQAIDTQEPGSKTAQKPSRAKRAPKEQTPAQGKGSGMDTAPFVFAGWEMDEAMVARAQKAFDGHIPAYLINRAGA